MKITNDVNYYQERLERLSKNDQDTIKMSIDEIEDILAGIEKGLRVLDRLDKYPDKIVIENKTAFTILVTDYKKLLD